jgi:hypothetical protein
MGEMSDTKSFMEYLREKRLTEDPNFHILAIYYSTLRDGGDGELLVKLLKGRMTVKGATYLRKVVKPVIVSREGC